MRRFTAVTFAVLLAVPLTLVLAMGPTSAGEITELDSSGACQPDGSFTITWTLNNPFDVSIEVTSASIEGVATQVVFTPTTIPAGGSATATTNVAGTVAGQITIDVTTSGQGPNDPGTLITTQGLPGNCPQPAATTTPATAAPTTATRAAAVARPHFTG